MGADVTGKTNPSTYGPRQIVRPSVARRLAGVLIPPLLFGGLIVALWYYASYGWLKGGRRTLLRPLHRVVRDGLLDWKSLHRALDAAKESGIVAAYGLIIAVVIGVLLATLMSQWRSVERAVFPYMVVLQTIPILALTPLIGMLFGYDRRPRVIVCVIFALYPIVVNTLFGLQSAEPGHHDLFTLNRASRWTRLRLLSIPASLPAVFAGLRISASLALIGGIVADFFFGQGKMGVGQLIAEYKNSSDSARMIGVIAVTAAIGVLVFLVSGWLERRSVGAWYERSSDRARN